MSANNTYLIYHTSHNAVQSQLGIQNITIYACSLAAITFLVNTIVVYNYCYALLHMDVQTVCGLKYYASFFVHAWKRYIHRMQWFLGDTGITVQPKIWHKNNNQYISNDHTHVYHRSGNFYWWIVVKIKCAKISCGEQLVYAPVHMCVNIVLK